MVGRSSGGRRRPPFWISGQCQLWLALSSVAWWRSRAEELRPGSLITRARLIGNNSIITQKPDQQKPQTQKTPSNSKPGHQSKVLRTKLKLPTSVRLWQLFLCGQPTKWVLLKDPPISHTRKGVSWPTSANRIALFRRVWYGVVWCGRGWYRMVWPYARGRKRPWHVIVEFSSLSYSYSFRTCPGLQCSGMHTTWKWEVVSGWEGSPESRTLWAKTTGICVRESRLPTHTETLLSFLCYPEHF